jgi:hypothetical protein
MRNMRVARWVPAQLVIAAAVLGLVGCGADDTDIGCSKSVCHLHLKEGGSLTLAGQKFSIEKVDDDSITLAADHFGLTLKKGLSVGFGKYHLTMGQTDDGSASVDVKQ